MKELALGQAQAQEARHHRIRLRLSFLLKQLVYYKPNFIERSLELAK